MSSHGERRQISHLHFHRQMRIFMKIQQDFQASFLSPTLSSFEEVQRFAQPWSRCINCVVHICQGSLLRTTYTLPIALSYLLLAPMPSMKVDYCLSTARRLDGQSLLTRPLIDPSGLRRHEKIAQRQEITHEIVIWPNFSFEIRHATSSLPHDLLTKIYRIRRQNWHHCL